MAVLLLMLVAGMSAAYVVVTVAEPATVGWLLGLVALAGATGSVLSRAVKLGKQPLRSDASTKTTEPPLGIRSLLSGWKVFFAQPVIGATAAVILFLVLSAGLVRFGSDESPDPALYAVLAFLAGFSEPFFVGILDKVAGQGGGSPG